MRRRWLSTLLAVAALCSASACKSQRQGIPLSQMRRLDVEYEDGPRGTLVARMVDEDESVAGGSDCPMPAPDARASLNGVPLKRMRGLVVSDEFAYNRDCIIELAFPGPMVEKWRGARGALPREIAVPKEIEEQGPIPQAARVSGPATLRIEQGTTRKELAVFEAFAPRRLLLVYPQDGIVGVGQKVTLRWQPATDHIAHDQVALSLRRRGSKSISADDVTIKSAELSFAGNDITFTVPNTLPKALHGECDIQFLGSAYVDPGIGPCPVDRCRVDLIFDAPSVPVQIR